MKSTEFQDIEGHKVRVQYSSLATQQAYRVYVEDSKGKDLVCLHLNNYSAQMLINALEELLER